MSARPKSDLPLTSHVMKCLVSHFNKHTPPSRHATPIIETAPQPVHARYTIPPLAALSCNCSGDPCNAMFDIGFAMIRSKGSSQEDVSPNGSQSSSITKLSLAAPSIISYAPQETAAKGSRRRLSDAAAKRWLKTLPSLVAEHQQVINRVQKLQLKGALDLHTNKYSAEVIWFTNCEGQPARLKCKWTESSSNSLTFDAVVGIKDSAHKIKISGHPHQLNSASLIFVPGKLSSSSSSSTAALDTQPLSSGAAATADDSSAAQQQAVYKAFDQPGLQLELGYNRVASAPIISATRRFSSSSSIGSWQLRQVKAAYDGKSNNLSLSAAAAAWNIGLVFPTEASGPLGLPQAPRGGGGGLWPKLQLQLTPDVNFDTL